MREVNRLQAIVEQLGLLPHHEVLEIGCGHGIAADLICRKLDQGHLLAIDRSEKMISAALRRNVRHVESGRADFLVADLEHFHPGSRRFDLILAIRVGCFRRNPRRAHEWVTPWLRTVGRIVAVFDPPTPDLHGTSREERAISSPGIPTASQSMLSRFPPSEEFLQQYTPQNP